MGGCYGDDVGCCNNALAVAVGVGVRMGWAFEGVVGGSEGVEGTPRGLAGGGMEGSKTEKKEQKLLREFFPTVNPFPFIACYIVVYIKLD